MRNKRIFKYLLVAIFISCTTLDDFIKISVGKEPAVIFDCDVYKAENDTVVLIGIKNVSIPSEGMRSKSIQFYLKNTNNELSVVNVNSNITSGLMQYSYVPREKAKVLIKEYSQLSDMMLFAVLLKGMTVDQQKLSERKTLGSGDLRNISELNTEIVKRKKIIFVIANPDLDKSVFIKSLGLNTFRLINS
jgi:hypothetical protein